HFSRLGQVANVTDVQNVEDAIGEDEFLSRTVQALAFIHQLFMCQNLSRHLERNVNCKGANPKRQSVWSNRRLPFTIAEFMTVPFFEENDQTAARREHLEGLRRLVGNVYPNKFQRSDRSGTPSGED